jgi:hypothetical protein
VDGAALGLGHRQLASCSVQLELEFFCLFFSPGGLLHKQGPRRSRIRGDPLPRSHNTLVSCEFCFYFYIGWNYQKHHISPHHQRVAVLPNAPEIAPPLLLRACLSCLLSLVSVTEHSVSCLLFLFLFLVLVSCFLSILVPLRLLLLHSQMD